MIDGVLAADTANGTADVLGWLVGEQDIEPHIPVFDKIERKDGTFPATDFTYDVNAGPQVPHLAV